METEHWIALTVALIAFLGTIVGVFGGKKKGHSTPERVARENLAADITHTPASPGERLDGKALSIAQDALAQAQQANARAEAANTRLTSVEQELDIFRRSYNALYWAWQEVITRWEELREDPNPPPTPKNIHHP